VNLRAATWVSVINFWAWNMIGPLSRPLCTRSVIERSTERRRDRAIL